MTLRVTLIQMEEDTMKRKATLRTTMMKAQHNSGSNLAATGPMQGWLRWLIASLVCTLGAAVDAAPCPCAEHGGCHQRQ
jgi:hypothetical protein